MMREILLVGVMNINIMAGDAFHYFPASRRQIRLLRYASRRIYDAATKVYAREHFDGMPR